MEPNSIEISDDLMFVLDNEGHGRDCHILRTFDAAKHQLDVWREKYLFDYDAAVAALTEFFKNQPVVEDITPKIERIARHILGIPSLACRNVPELDFYRLHVQAIDLALRAAYEVGRGLRR
jgi:hypothetical protein